MLDWSTCTFCSATRDAQLDGSVPLSPVLDPSSLQAEAARASEDQAHCAPAAAQYSPSPAAQHATHIGRHVGWKMDAAVILMALAAVWHQYRIFTIDNLQD